MGGLERPSGRVGPAVAVSGGVTDTLFERAARWYVRRKVDGERGAKERVESVAGPWRDAERVADLLVQKEAKKAAIRGFVTGLAGSPWTAIPLALANLDGATGQQAKLAATLGFLKDPRYFDQPDWELEVLKAVTGVDVSGLDGKDLAKVIAKRFAIGRAKKTGVRLAANIVPVLGGVAGATLEYVSLKRTAERLRSQPTGPSLVALQHAARDVVAA